MKKTLMMLAVVLLAAPAFADSGALKLSLCSRAAVAVPGNTQEVKGLDLGIISATKKVTGAQLDLFYAHTSQEMTGWSSALITNHRAMKGVQAGIANYTAKGKGVQLGIVNISSDDFRGVQFGIYNAADTVKGLQVGIVNTAQNIQGLQIGVVNMAANGYFPAMILVNGRF